MKFKKRTKPTTTSNVGGLHWKTLYRDRRCETCHKAPG